MKDARLRATWSRWPDRSRRCGATALHAARQHDLHTATVATGLALIWWLFRRWLAVMLAGVAIGVPNSTVAIYVLLDQPFTLVPASFRHSCRH